MDDRLRQKAASRNSSHTVYLMVEYAVAAGLLAVVIISATGAFSSGWAMTFKVVAMHMQNGK